MNLPKFDFIQLILVLLGVVFVIIIVNHFVTNLSNNTEQFKTETSKKNPSRAGKQSETQKNKPVQKSNEPPKKPENEPAKNKIDKK